MKKMEAFPAEKERKKEAQGDVADLHW